MQETPPNSSTSISSFLKRKHSRFPIQSPLYQTHLGNLCSICLEYDKYSLSKCIQCKQCNSFFHLNCYLQNSSSQSIDNNKLLCHKCLFINDTQSPTPQCFLCSDTNGIIFQFKSTNKWCHVYCKRFFKEIIQYESQSPPHNDIELRKWRYQSICKVCHCKVNHIPVIKCINKKCKNYYHIHCAIQKNVIFNLAYQNDFFGLNGENGKNAIYPFYCNSHNRSLIVEYKEYIKQMDEVLKNNDNGTDEKKKKENVIETQTQVEFIVPVKTVENDCNGTNNNNNNKENKSLSVNVNVNFDSEHKNALVYGNTLSVNDELDFLDKLEQNGSGNGMNINNSENKIIYGGFTGDYFL